DRPNKGQLWALGCKWPRLQPFGQVMPIRLVSCTCRSQIERERERDRPEKGRLWWFSISGKENGLGERRPWGYGYPRHRERSVEGLQPRGSAGHTYRPDSPYGQLGRMVGTSEWVRVAKGHELPRGTSVQRVLVPKGFEFQTVPLDQGLGRTKWTVCGCIVKRMDGFGSDQPQRLSGISYNKPWGETHMMAMEGRLYQYLLSRRWLIKSGSRIMFHDD
ncbi:hypothetical protein IGI04_043113, partial [Brassica rapa subsp. trilocularis]